MASDIGTAYVNIVPKAEGIKSKMEGVVNPAAGSAGMAGGKLMGLKMAAAVGTAAIGTAVVAGVKKSLEEGAALQQSMGGIETLFKGSADTVVKNARNAFKTVGVSANEYMENVTSFSASLIKSLDGDTAKAAQTADMAMVDMSDNANKMGTDIEAIQNAYQGFAKQNYTMLDNLKLGYGGTKEEMERLLQDASKISGQKYDMSNLNDVYEAIHVIQKDLDITGTTAKEASETLSGSFSSMKAAFTDLMGNLAIGENVEQSMQNLIQTIGTFLVGNLIPMVIQIFRSLPGAIGGAIKSASGVIPQDLAGTMQSGLDAISAKLPGYLNKGVEILTNIGTGIIEHIPDLLDMVSRLVTSLADFIAKNYPKIVAAGMKLLMGLVQALVRSAPRILAAVVKLQGALVKAFLKLAPLGLKAGIQIIKQLGIGVGKMSAPIVGKIKAFADKFAAPLKKAVDKIKGLFPLNIGKIFSNFKLPHINVSGGKAPFGIGGMGKKPSFSVDWYAKGGILTKPTLFGGGEAGSEAIVPLDPFWKRLGEARGGNTFNITMNVDGAENPEAWATRFSRSLELEMRTI